MIFKYKKKIFHIFIIFVLFFGLKSNAEENQNTIEIKNPIFTTKSIDGSPYEIKAKKGLQRENYLDLFVIEAKLKTNKNIWIYLIADQGKYDQSSGEISLKGNIEIHTESNKRIFADQAIVNTNSKIITLKKNVKYQDSNIFISADESTINNELSNISYYGDVKSKIFKK
jgi:hypothetical protein